MEISSWFFPPPANRRRVRHFQHHNIAAAEKPSRRFRNRAAGAKKYPALAILADQYEQVRIYRGWSFGRSSVFRAPQPAKPAGSRFGTRARCMKCWKNIVSGNCG
jgi:hypothetical protein